MPRFYLVLLLLLRHRLVLLVLLVLLTNRSSHQSRHQDPTEWYCRCIGILIGTAHAEASSASCAKPFGYEDFDSWMKSFIDNGRNSVHTAGAKRATFDG